MTDWQSFAPFIPFFASFFGVLAAFLLQWLGKLYDRGKDRKQFLKDLKHELETVSSLLIERGHLLPTDMWESGKSSGFLSLLSHEVKIKFATTYFSIENHNYEAVKVRDLAIRSRIIKGDSPKDIIIGQDGKTTVVESPYTFAELLWYTLSSELILSEKKLKKHIDELLKESIWE